MTIKIKTERVRIWCSDLARDKHQRIVSESDWRKLMKLVRTVEGNAHGKYKSINDIYDALEALEKKK